MEDGKSDGPGDGTVEGAADGKSDGDAVGVSSLTEGAADIEGEDDGTRVGGPAGQILNGGGPRSVCKRDSVRECINLTWSQ